MLKVYRHFGCTKGTLVPWLPSVILKFSLRILVCILTHNTSSGFRQETEVQRNVTIVTIWRLGDPFC